jgi:hypothetical protein
VLAVAGMESTLISPLVKVVSFSAQVVSNLLQRGDETNETRNG